MDELIDGIPPHGDFLLRRTVLLLPGAVRQARTDSLEAMIPQ
jgi:hypothetical protein